MTDLNATWNEATRGPRMSEATGKVIFKYQMPVKEVFSIDLPKDAQIIRVADLDGMFWLWAIVDTNAPMEKRYFRAFKTGAKIPDDFDTSHYLGMCAVFIQMELGLYIFEDTERWNEVEDARVEAALPAALRDRFHHYDEPVSKTATIREIAQKLGKKVIDIKASKFEPGDMAGLPEFCEPERTVKPFSAYQKQSENGEFFDWGAMASDLFGYDIYKPKPTKLTQRNIDAIEAAGGFEEEDD